MPRKPAEFEESTHYNGEAVVRFYPGAHYYSVTDNGYIDPETGEPAPFKNKRMGGATSLTGTMDKGQGFMMWPMYEMKKFLKQYFRANSLEDLFNSPLTLEDILKAGTDAHRKKSDRGKLVGTNAHSWHEAYLKEARRVQEAIGMTSIADLDKPEMRAAYNEAFVEPQITEVEDIASILRRSYIEVFKAVNPKNVEEYMKLPKLLFEDAEVQQAVWIEASMLYRATVAMKQWFDIHDIFVHGTEDTVYSRTLQICGKYDGDIEARCSKACNWCYLNGDEEKILDVVNEFGEDHTFTGRYIEDYKSTNASNSAPKGIYSEYLGQCGVYDVAKTEEFPDINYNGHLILNGSKNELVDKEGKPLLDKKGQPLRPFNTHFSFERERNRDWAICMADMKEFMYTAEKEVAGSA